MSAVKLIESGKAFLGIELGSTRIKAVLLDDAYNTIGTGGYGWENQLVDGVWTYDLETVHKGVQGCYSDLIADVKSRHGVDLKEVAGIGISGMMHGYLVFDEDMKQLAPFKTWRNTITGEAAEALTEAFDYPIPLRWSVAHLFHTISHRESHVKDIRFMTTLSGYVHWLLTGEKAMGLGEASGMFPIDPATMSFDEKHMTTFDAMAAKFEPGISIKDILPEVKGAGQIAGSLTAEGAAFLDVTGNLKAGSPVCPPEGDAATGMVATNSVKKRTGNVSAGTSIFAMVVLDDLPSKAYPEIDLIMTPSGAPVGMVHGNNCTSDLNAWVGLFGEFGKAMGMTISPDDLYGTLYREAMKGDVDAGGLLAYNYLSGEHITGLEEGRPLFVRSADSHFGLANFMKTHLYTTMGAIRIGMDIMTKKENVQIDALIGHGGLFKTEGVGQNIMANALEVPVSVMTTAGEGGAWGMAVLAAYIGKEVALEDFLSNEVFKDAPIKTVAPVKEESEGFKVFMERYNKGLAIEQAAVDHLR